MMMASMRADREWQVVPVHNRHDSHTLPALGRSHSITTTLGQSERRANICFPFIQPTCPRSMFANSVNTSRNTSLRHHY